MPNYMRRLLLMRRPAQVADPAEMLDLRMGDGSWRQGFRVLSASSTAETGEVIIWVCTERVQGGSLGGAPCGWHDVAREADARISLFPPLALGGILAVEGQ